MVRLVPSEDLRGFMSVDRVKVREVVGARRRGHAVAHHVPGHELGDVGQAGAEQRRQPQRRW